MKTPAKEWNRRRSDGPLEETACLESDVAQLEAERDALLAALAEEKRKNAHYWRGIQQLRKWAAETVATLNRMPMHLEEKELEAPK